MTRHRPAAIAFLLAALGLGCDPQACDDPPHVVAVEFDYDCGPDDDMATLGAWGPRFVGAVVQGCDAGMLRVELDEAGTWRVEAKVGQGETLECELVVDDAMLTDGVVVQACEVES